MPVSQRRFGLFLWIVLVILLWASAVLAATLISASARAPAPTPPVNLPGFTAYTSGSIDVARAVKPAVVFVQVEERAPGVQEEMPQLPNPWRRFFGPSFPFGGQQPSPPRLEIGQGSGMVIDPAGYILTNRHVVANATKVTVRLSRGEEYAATVLGTDRLTDLAVIKIEPKQTLTAVRLGNADRVEPGAWVMAIGFPFGGRASGGRFDEPLRYEPSVTTGVVSATRRQTETDLAGESFRDLIQTDAPLDPGNSGGPLVTDHAEVIGVNQSIFTSGPDGGITGVGFAIPIDARTKDVIETLKRGKPVVRGQLGVSIEALTPALQQVYGAPSGVFVNDVQPGGPAAKAGLKGEDVITSYGSTKVTSPDQLVDLVHSTKPRTTVSVGVLRDGKPLTLQVTVEALGAQAAARPTQPGQKKLGLTVQNLSPQQAKQVGGAGGVLVTAVDPLGEGARAGVAAGDVVLQVNRQVTNSIETYQQAVGRLRAGGPVVLRVWHSGKVYTAQISHLSG